MGICTPPYCLGTGGFCDCNCNCCPPDPCYDAWNYIFHCGTPIASWEGPINQGCDCPPNGYGLTSNSLGINFPKFDTKEFEFSLKEDTVSALTAVCSIPCESTTVRLTTSGCCLYFIDIFHFKAVGAGILTSNLPRVCDSIFQVLVNNVDISGGIAVSDCMDLYITIIPPANDCCVCCLKDNYGELHVGGSPLISTKTSNGMKKILINQELYKKQLLRRMLRSK